MYECTGLLCSHMRIHKGSNAIAGDRHSDSSTTSAKAISEEHMSLATARTEVAADQVSSVSWLLHVFCCCKASAYEHNLSVLALLNFHGKGFCNFFGRTYVRQHDILRVVGLSVHFTAICIADADVRQVRLLQSHAAFGHVWLLMTMEFLFLFACLFGCY